MTPLIALLLATVAVPSAAAPGRYAGTTIGPPPADLRLDPFYQRYVDAGGVPVVSSAKVPDDALLFARDIAIAMLADRPDLRRWMAASGYRVAIIALTEGLIDLPEQRHWTKPAADDPRLTLCERKHYVERIGRLSDRDYWNNRARGMGGPLTTAPAENLLGTPGTWYYGENTFVHEFSHAILAAIRQRDTALHAAVERAYATAMARGAWRGEYAATTVDEYWAEGTQLWFNTNRLIVVDGQRLLNDDDLQRYDPTLYALLAQVYGDRHRLPGDVFYRHPARVPPGDPPRATAEIC
ncbi:glycoside hydrolase [Sphingomonas sp. Leaf67]|uniref:glycoside hydrolase n=1 Tax=Sphingomonas sp. Leaf67 TaxID=1736230 RepID=UPI000AD5B2BA|nr:glycoside hydrolase [Sphingomonas sp. Leaf67]